MWSLRKFKKLRNFFLDVLHGSARTVVKDKGSDYPTWELQLKEQLRDRPPRVSPKGDGGEEKEKFF
jgi:hypothetical protein